MSELPVVPVDSPTENRLLGGRVILRQPSRGYRAGLDAALLAAACDAAPGGRVIEAGCGAGAVLMTAAMRFALGLGETQAPDARLGLTEQLAQVERSLLSEALRRTGGQASAAAEALKLPRKTFYDKLAKYGLKPEEYR